MIVTLQKRKLAKYCVLSPPNTKLSNTQNTTNKYEL